MTCSAELPPTDAYMPFDVCDHAPSTPKLHALFALYAEKDVQGLPRATLAPLTRSQAASSEKHRPPGPG